MGQTFGLVLPSKISAFVGHGYHVFAKDVDRFPGEKIGEWWGFEMRAR